MVSDERLKALQSANEALQKDQSAARTEAASVKKENEALKKDMEEKTYRVEGTFRMAGQWRPYEKTVTAPNEAQARESTDAEPIRVC
jgi:hypothetical protein